MNIKRNHKRISSWSALLKNGGAHPLFWGGMSTHLFGGSSTHYLRGHEHSLFKEQSNGERVNNCKMNMKEKSSWNALLKKWGRAPIIFSREHIMNFFLSCPSCICSLVLCLAFLQTMSACAPLNDECSCPPGKWVLDEHSQNNGCSTSTPKIMGARPHFSRERFKRLFLSCFIY